MKTNFMSGLLRIKFAKGGKYYLAQKYSHTLGQSSFIDQIVLIVQIQITQYLVWFPWAAITATIRRGILS